MSTYTVLRHQHSSLQFSDSEKQQEADVAKLFATGKNFPVKSGTESGRDNALFDLVDFYAKKNDHLLHNVQGNWVAVDKTIIKQGSQRRGSVFVADNALMPGVQADRAFPTFQFTHAKPGVGILAVAAFHYARDGRHPSDPNHDVNHIYANRIAEWMREAAKGSKIALGAGDFNMIDSIKKQDWAFGNDFTSMADELRTYYNTGFGPIDGFVSYDHDARVKAKKLVVLNDDKLRLHTDHFVARGAWTIRHLKGI